MLALGPIQLDVESLGHRREPLGRNNKELIMLINAELQWGANAKQQAFEGVSFGSRSAKLDACCMIFPLFPEIVKGQQWALHLHPQVVPKEVVQCTTLILRFPWQSTPRSGSCETAVG